MNRDSSPRHVARSRWAAASSTTRAARRRSFTRMARSARASTARNSCRSGCTRATRGCDQSFEEFSLTAMAARQDRMLLPDAAIDGFGFTDYGYHLPAIPYGAWLRQLALRRGVRCHATRELGIRVDSQRGIAGLLLDDGRAITGDFFLDVTGRRSAARTTRWAWASKAGATHSPSTAYSAPAARCCARCPSTRKFARSVRAGSRWPRARCASTFSRRIAATSRRSRRSSRPRRACRCRPS